MSRLVSAPAAAPKLVDRATAIDKNCADVSSLAGMVRAISSVMTCSGADDLSMEKDDIFAGLEVVAEVIEKKIALVETDAGHLYIGYVGLSEGKKVGAR